MKGTRPMSLPQPSRIKSGRRTCGADDCSTKLSVYNLGVFCWQHADVQFPNHRGKRLRPRDS